MSDSPTTYVRKDDPLETVQIVSQARTPNGPLTYQIITPVEQRGRQQVLPAQEFFMFFKDPVQEAAQSQIPVRPLSGDSADAWRRWALHIETQLAEVTRQRDRAESQLPSWDRPQR